METFLNGEDGYSIKYFKQKLKECYGDDIIITSITGKSSIVSSATLHIRFFKKNGLQIKQLMKTMRMYE